MESLIARVALCSALALASFLSVPGVAEATPRGRGPQSRGARAQRELARDIERAVERAVRNARGVRGRGPHGR